MVQIRFRSALAFGVVIALLYPLTREITARQSVEHQLLAAGAANDAAALQRWLGTTQSFMTMVRERCALTNGAASPTCARYRTASN